ncbi:hypothetical protein SLEP1_g10799 [Rubroshorea leprosula]|uniref:Uncharacterized protein n=1 Tax=Rubroshorea leprosula TaxID=152421 RepID=A0AAV5IKL9_9ROSI|nr:hypothetical protein SLEP1_g10799 [Rubroshorea leprosula]
MVHGCDKKKNDENQAQDGQQRANPKFLGIKVTTNEDERLYQMVVNEEGRAAQHGSSKVQQDKLQMLMK